MGRLLLIVGLCCFAAGPVSAQHILVEAESFTASYDAGGASIVSVSCSGASGGMAVEGLDYPGDWIEVTLNIWNGSFADSMRSAGLLDMASTLSTTVYGAGPGGGDLSSIFDTYGLGIG